MNSDTEHNPAYAGKPINNSVNFCETAHAVTREEKEKCQDNITRLINETIKEIHER